MAFDITSAKPIKRGFDISSARPVEQSLQEKPRTSLIEKSLNVLPLAGGVIGGIAGAPLAPVTFGASSIGGAALGGAAGESYKQIGRRMMGLSSPKTSLEAAKNIGKEGAIQGASEAIGLGVIKAAKPILKPIGKGLAKVGQALTGVKATSFERLAKNPMALFSKSKRAAGEELGKVLEKEGISTKSTAETLFDPQLTKARDIASDVYTKIAEGKPVTAQEVYKGKQAVNRIIASTPSKDKTTIRELTLVNHQLDDLLGNLSGLAQKASKKYSKSALASEFRKLLPVTKSGDISIARNIFLPAFISGGSYASGRGSSPEASIGAVLAQSPALAGGLTAGGSAVGSLMASPIGRRIFINSIVNKIAKKKWSDKLK